MRGSMHPESGNLFPWRREHSRALLIKTPWSHGGGGGGGGVGVGGSLDQFAVESAVSLTSRGDLLFLL